ncbi:hypothetical protein OF83DRAFT_1162935 [Amylostereum chailletii]|nr:hypothetical protein OF83DRAFT_1162935 [Amylostereum chailletii]
MSSSKKVWLVTGATSGLGRSIVQAALAKGDNVIATARDPSRLRDLESSTCKTFQLDVTDTPEVLQNKAREALALWGTIDVVVNNAAITVLGPVEELGRSAWQAGAPVCIYSSSKAAVHAVTETWSAELAPFKVKVLLVEPGSLRTDNLKAASSVSAKYRTHQIPAYVPFWAAGQKMSRELDGKQPGDPTKAAAAIVDVVRGEGAASGRPWPLLLALGKDAENGIRNKCQEVTKTVDAWADVSQIAFEQ